MDEKMRVFQITLDLKKTKETAAEIVENWPLDALQGDGDLMLRKSLFASFFFSATRTQEISSCGHQGKPFSQRLHLTHSTFRGCNKKCCAYENMQKNFPIIIVFEIRLNKRSAKLRTLASFILRFALVNSPSFYMALWLFLALIKINF